MVENCSCIAESLHQQFNSSFSAASGMMSSDMFLSNATAETAKCDSGCNRLGLFLFAVGVMIFLLFILRVPTAIVTLR